MSVLNHFVIDKNFLRYGEQHRSLQTIVNYCVPKKYINLYKFENFFVEYGWTLVKSKLY